MSTLVPRLVDRQVLKRLSDEIGQKMVVPHLADSEFLIRNQYFSTVHTACSIKIVKYSSSFFPHEIVCFSIFPIIMYSNFYF